MRLASSLLAFSILFTSAAMHAHADTYSFAFSGPGTDSVSFTLPSEFHSTTGGDNLGINEMNIAVDLNGVTSIQGLGFYVPGNGGGFAIEGIPDYAFNGPQLITTQLYTPFPNFPSINFYKDATFNLGTYTLDEVDGDHLGVGTLVVSDLSTASPSAVPEPSTFALLGTGVLGAAGVICRRFTGA